MGKSAYKDANAPQCYVIHTSPVWLINVENILTFQIVYTVSEYIYIYIYIYIFDSKCGAKLVHEDRGNIGYTVW